MKTKIPIVRTFNSGLALALGFAFLSLTAHAVPYASQVTRSGNTVSFVLNQEAQGLVVLRDGANPVYPGTTPGVLSFDMTGFTSYSIIVTGNTAKAWTNFIPNGADRSFYLPRGLAINKNPASTNFGKVYVSEARGGTPAANLRTTSDGIYVLRADGVAINSAAYTGGVDWTRDGSAEKPGVAGTAPLRSTIGPDDHLYVVDDPYQTVYEFNADLSVATPLIDASNITGTGSATQDVNSVWVEGTQALGNRKVTLMNGNYYDTARKGLIQYDLAGNATATPGDTGTQLIGPPYFTYYGYDMARDSSGFWYVNNYRANPNQAAPVAKFDGSIVPNNTPTWEADKSIIYAESLDLNERGGVVAAGRYDNGVIYFFDTATGLLKESFDCGSRCRELAFDAAGNLVTADNSAEWVRFWSPGGFTIATTKSDGTFELLTPDTLTVDSLSDPIASEEGNDPATFTISRSGGPNDNLLVYFTLGGTATSNVDYTVSVSSPFLFQAGMTSTNITITPVNDTSREPTETVILTLSANPGYYLGNPSAATVTITDNDGALRYWDINGAAWGAGSDAPAGVWGAGAFWSADPNGEAATTAWTPGAAAVFSAGSDAYSTFTVNVSGAQSADYLSFEEGLVTLQGGTLTLANSDATQVAPGLTATINSVIAGNNGFGFTGPGTLVLGGANTYGGPTTINDGLLQLSAANRIPDNSAVTVGPAGILDLNVNDETIGSLAGAEGAIVMVYPGNTLTFGGDNTSTVWNGKADIGGLLVKVGTGKMSLNAGSTTDPLVISNGTVSINAAARLGSLNDITLDHGATLESTSTGVGSDFISSGKTVTIGPGGGTLKVADASAILMVHDSSLISGTGTLTKDGPGELRTYNVEHSFNKLIVKQGLYTAGHSTSPGYSTSFGAIPATVTPDAITLLNGAQIRKAGGVSVTLDPKQGITLGAGGGTIRAYAGDAGAQTFEIPGPISGSGPLVLGSTADVGMHFVLSGANTYTGGTFINAGTNDVRVDGGLGTGDVTVASGATLILSQGNANAYIHSEATLTLNGANPRVNLAFTGNPNVIKALYFGTTQMPAGTWGAIGSGATHESAFFTGTGLLQVTTGNAPQPVGAMTIGPVSGGNATISYSGGQGTQFVLLRSLDVAAPLNTWTRVATNAAAAGSFPISVVADPRAFYLIKSE